MIGRKGCPWLFIVSRSHEDDFRLCLMHCNTTFRPFVRHGNNHQHTMSCILCSATCVMQHVLYTKYHIEILQYYLSIYCGVILWIFGCKVFICMWFKFRVLSFHTTISLTHCNLEIFENEICVWSVFLKKCGLLPKSSYAYSMLGKHGKKTWLKKSTQMLKKTSYFTTNWVCYVWEELSHWFWSGVMGTRTFLWYTT